MSDFTYVKVRSVEEALEYLARYGGSAHVYAGGTDLLVKIKNGALSPKILIDIGCIKNLDYIEEYERKFVRIGVMTTFSRLLEHPLLQTSLIALWEAISVIGSVQVRNLATMGGNLCNASPAADSAPPLVAYGASVNIVSAEEKRRVLVEEFLTGPGTADLREGEMVESIDIPLDRGIVGASFKRFGRRKAVELATVSSAVAISDKNEVYISLGAVGRKALRARKTETHLSGILESNSAYPGEEAFSMIKKEIEPISDVRASKEYRLALSQVLTERAFAEAVSRSSKGANKGS